MIPSGIWIRRAGMEDSQRLLAWHNDPTTRANSITSTLVTLEEHEAWLAGSLTDTTSAVFVGYHLDDPIGSVRFTDVPGDHYAAEISVVVAPEEQGQGYGAVLIFLGCQAAPGKRLIIAYIKPGNVASIRAFKRAGFRYSGQESVDNVELERYELRHDTS